MTPLIVPLHDPAGLSPRLSRALGAQIAELTHRRFPDGETYLRYLTDPAGRSVILLATLDRPDEKLASLLFAAAGARDLGAARIGLIAPYLCYMRQDDRFAPGEAITSRYFAALLADRIDWLVTIDPHLHRYAALSEIYPIPNDALQSASIIADWIAGNVERPLLIGPDSESKQWVAAVARNAGIPFVVLEKVRRGDRDVSVSVPQIEQWSDRTPILLDDIISTGRTMAQTIRHLVAAGMRPPVCIGTHAIFAGDAEQVLMEAGAGRLVTTNTIAHPTNAIDITPLLVDPARRLSAVADR